MALFLMFLANYGSAMYICYPRTGSKTHGTAPNFNSMDGALLELIPPSDFVVLKVDIDMPEIELSIMRTILASPDLAALIDETWAVVVGSMPLAWILTA